MFVYTPAGIKKKNRETTNISGDILETLKITRVQSIGRINIIYIEQNILFNAAYAPRQI